MRRSLPDDELLNLADDANREHSATLDMIEKLQAELELREREARELSDWENDMRLRGTPEPATAPSLEAMSAELSLQEQQFASSSPARDTPFADQPPEDLSASFINAESSVAAWPVPSLIAEAPVAPGLHEAPEAALTEPVADVAEELAPEPVEPSRPLPAWEVPAPGPNWAPGHEYGMDPEPEPVVSAEPAEVPRADEPALQARPAEERAVEAPAFQETAIQEPEFHSFDGAEIPIADSFVLASASPHLAWEPQPWDVAHDSDVPHEADLQQEADLPQDADLPHDADVVHVAEIVKEPEESGLLEELAAEPGTERFTPPPLIEPGRHGPPLLPSHRPPLISPEFGAPSTVPAEGIASSGQAIPAPEAGWVAPTGTPLAPAAGDTLEGPRLAAATVAGAAASGGKAREFSFDDLLADDAPATDEEPQLYRDSEPSTAADSAPAAIFIEPMPVAAGEAVPTETGSITVIDQAYEEELPDDVDETDRAVFGLGAVSVDTAGIAVITGTIHPPSGPISTVRIPQDEVVLASGEPVRMKVFSLEESGLEATPVDRRVGRAARLFWLWFASNSSILSLGLGATIFAVGMSLRQAVVSVLAGVALSFIPLGLTTLAGKRSGQPTMVVSRATFGLLGNIIPAILALVTRVFWGAVLLWLLASSVAIILVGAGLDGGLGDRQLLLICLAVAFLVALLVAFAGYPLFARIQLILSVISAILVVGLIALTWKYVDVNTALTTPDGPWVLTITGAVLVFSFVGLVWANSGADLARYQRPGTSGATSMLWATMGTTLPTFVLIAYGALLAASDKGIAAGFLGSPLDTLSIMLPDWYPVPLLAATALSLLSGIILSLYSGGFALQAIGLQVRRQWSIVIVGVLLGALALLLAFGVTGGVSELFRDAATTLAVPTAAWAGIFAAETMIRNRRFESQSLLVRGGIYADVRWVNLLSLIVITVVGYGLTTASISWLGWQGYVFTFLGVPLRSDLAASDVGVLVALVLGLLVPLVAGVPAIRKQEALRPNI